MIEFKNVEKVYPGNLIAAKDINLKIDKGEFICIIGTSGSGKTTIMRMINRMNQPTKGQIFINGENILDKNAVELRRSIGYVIQRIGLMPHMTIYDNVAMVPRLLKWDEEKIKNRVLSLMKKANLDQKYLDSYPSQLSGGQQQRVGVIRALAADQEIILMDEPFGALDPITRDNLQVFTKQLQQELGKTIIFVTHDIDEAIALSDRMIIMDKGRIVQFDTPENILMKPTNDFVYNLLGEERIQQALFDYQTIDKIMLKHPLTIQPDTTIKQAAQIMRRNRVDTLFIVDNQQNLLGHINIFGLQDNRHPETKVSEIMKDTTYLKPNTKVRDVIYYINKLGYRNIPVVENEKLVGLITRSVVVDAIYEGLWQDYLPEEGQYVDDTSDFPFNQRTMI